MKNIKKPIFISFLTIIIFRSAIINSQEITSEYDLSLPVWAFLVNQPNSLNFPSGKYQAENGSDIYVDDKSGSLFNIPIIQHSSLRQHSGWNYAGHDVNSGPGFFGDQVKSCAIADLNGDEYLDAVAMTVTTYQVNDSSAEADALNPERRPRVHLLINNKDGSFLDGSFLIKGNIDRVYSYKDINVSDINNDGIDDILTPSEGGGYGLIRDDGIMIMMSQPDGTFQDATSLIDFPRTTVDRGEFSENVIQVTTSILLAIDINNDGWKDIFTLGSTHDEVGNAFPNILINEKGKKFVPWDKYSRGNPGLLGLNDFLAFRGGKVADVDLDGDEDLIVMCYNQCFPENSDLYPNRNTNGIVFINDNGDLNTENMILLPPGLFGEINKNDSLDVGDLNGDGYPDIVFVSGQTDPYYVNRSIQIMINDHGKQFIDETSQRINDLRDEFNGHAEGNLYLIDYDQDGDLDIFDFQVNVRDGFASLTTPGGDNSYPYWPSGVALFLNDGSGIFEPTNQDIIKIRSLDEAIESNQNWRLDSIKNPNNVCPIDFGGSYGYGFLLATNGYPSSAFPEPEGGQTSAIGSVRRLIKDDKKLLIRGD